MSPAVQVILSGALTFGVPLALAIRELRVTRRGGGGWRPDPVQPTPPAPKPLPSCLIPQLPPRPRAARVLEQV